MRFILGPKTQNMLIQFCLKCSPFNSQILFNLRRLIKNGVSKNVMILLVKKWKVGRKYLHVSGEIKIMYDKITYLYCL